MIYYVAIDPINGRKDLARLVDRFHEFGIYNAEYHSGGWDDHSPSHIMPHIRFLDEEEALLYTLKVGGKVLTVMPTLANH